MDMRDTPETDAEHAQFAMGGFTLDFCRKLERERDDAREKYCQVLTDNMLHIATITRLERERDEAKLFIEELVDLAAYGLGKQESIWSLDAMKKAREAIAKAKNF